MGESRDFSAGYRQGFAPGFQDRAVYARHPEPVLSAARPGYQAGAYPGWDQAASVQGYVPPPAAQAAVSGGWGAVPPQGYPGTAQADPYPQPAAPTRERQTSTVMHGLGAVLSVALIVGAGGWMWQIMKRDVAGVPVVRALEGPLRVSPENPGGRQAAHQGLSVNELAAAREETPREQIVLAPPPLDLSGDDLLRSRPQESQTQHSAEFEDQPIPVALQQDVAMPVAETATGMNGASVVSTLGFNSPTRRAVTVSPRPPARNASQAAASATRVASLGSVATDAAPLAQDLAASVANSVAVGLSGVRDVDIDPATIGPGTRLVQLGAYDDVAAARAAWDALSSRFSPLLDDRGRVIEAAHSGGSVFYRLRAHGFSDERDARRFCAALVDQQIDCIPVLIR
ncbi:MAG: SPOR domain-containing protein [Natronohydrobacter sp.]|nr:SPOR domain-containing protein [Natronohydrobacter sp.]